jgi:predicted amidohydrolase
MNRSLHIATLQPQLRWRHVMPNMMHIRKVVEGLPAAVQCVVLPENWAGISAEDDDLETHTAQSRQFLQTLARARRATIIGGTVLRRAADDRLETVTLVFDPAGEPAGEYVKRVLFGREQDTHRPGSAPLVVDVAGVRVAILICADLWRYESAAELSSQADVLCVPARTGVLSDNHVLYARGLWHALALTRAMECGIPVVVSDWAAGRHGQQDADISVGSPHAGGMTYDPGILHRRSRDKSGPLEATARSYTSAQPALGGAVHYTAGASSICDPGGRPDMIRVQRALLRGEAGELMATIDLDDVQRYREYRRSVGLLGG